MEQAATQIKEQYQDVYVKTIEFDFAMFKEVHDYQSKIMDKI